MQIQVNSLKSFQILSGFSPWLHFHRVLQNPCYCKEHDTTGYESQNNRHKFPCSEIAGSNLAGGMHVCL